MAIYFIAEAGVNHNGDIGLAKKLIDIALEAGADAVKFQTFNPKSLVSQDAPMADYQIKNIGASQSQQQMLEKLSLPHEEQVELAVYANERGIEFLSTPFDNESLDFLTGTLKLSTIKIPSGEITNAPFLLSIARVSEQVILSTGMCDLSDIEAALGVLAFGFTAAESANPCRQGFLAAYSSEAGQAALKKRVKILHCTSEYPAPLGEVNLRAMETIRSSFQLPVGYSDHTAGIHITLAAAALGACVIEKHYTIDRSMDGPDHKASIEPNELRTLISQMRDIEKSLGTGCKRPTESEWKNRLIVRKSLVAKTAIASGGAFTAEKLTCKRPGGGLSPFLYWDYCGRVAARDYLADDLIDP